MIETQYLGLTMTVAELIVELQKLPSEMAVISEGCDCLGAVRSVSVEEDRTVLLCRNEDVSAPPVT